MCFQLLRQNIECVVDSQINCFLFDDAVSGKFVKQKFAVVKHCIQYSCQTENIVTKPIICVEMWRKINNNSRIK